MKTGKKLTAVLLALNMLLGLLPGQAFAAFGSAGEDVSEMNAIEAIGIDTMELVSALRDGDTLADVAREHDVRVSHVVDAVVASEQDRR